MSGIRKCRRRLPGAPEGISGRFRSPVDRNLKTCSLGSRSLNRWVPSWESRFLESHCWWDSLFQKP